MKVKAKECYAIQKKRGETPGIGVTDCVVCGFQMQAPYILVLTSQTIDKSQYTCLAKLYILLRHTPSPSVIVNVGGLLFWSPALPYYFTFLIILYYSASTLWDSDQSPVHILLSNYVADEPFSIDTFM